MIRMNEYQTYCITCPKGMEELVSDELKSFGCDSMKATVGGVYFEGKLELAYRACLWSRYANRVLLVLCSFEQSPAISSELAVYTAASSIPWDEHMPRECTFVVDFNGTNKAINNSQFGALKVKDAIVDYMRDKTGQRPDVDKKSPDLRVQVRLAKGRLQIALDLCGVSLHQRGYRTEQGVASLKENLAAAILARSGWLDTFKSRPFFIDPMCGSATFLIEAAMMSLDIAPGLQRLNYAFLRWNNHDSTVWERLLKEAKERADRGKAGAVDLHLYGTDGSDRMCSIAQSNIARVGLSQWIKIEQKEVEEFSLPETLKSKNGLLLSNPPYGERLGQLEALRETYRLMAERLKAQCAGWTLAVFTGNSELAREMRLRPRKSNKFYNGSIPCELFIYDLLPEEEASLKRKPGTTERRKLSEKAEMVANRLRKNLRSIEKWAKNTNTHSYRIYDADMPEYSAALDSYEGRLHLQEYAAPKSVDAAAAEKRFDDLVDAIVEVFDVERDDIAIKTRRRNRGSMQYERFESRSEFFNVIEGDAKLRVNLWDYLDTGLFLDHRPLRLRISEEAKGKRFLNLFCYTATATVHAALGGASESVSVDMSKAYLDWAHKNFEQNHLNLQRHKLVESDCMKWLNDCRQGFDLIMLDPPTFSNSKKMEGVLDVQRDHPSLIKRCMELLAPGGRLYFSSNLRNFKLDAEIEEIFGVQNITELTIDEDFKRNKKIHQCYLIEHE